MVSYHSMQNSNSEKKGQTFFEILFHLLQRINSRIMSKVFKLGCQMFMIMIQHWVQVFFSPSCNKFRKQYYLTLLRLHQNVRVQKRLWLMTFWLSPKTMSILGNTWKSWFDKKYSIIIWWAIYILFEDEHLGLTF